MFDNSNHDGRVPVTLDSEGTMIDCNGNSSLTVTPGNKQQNVPSTSLHLCLTSHYLISLGLNLFTMRIDENLVLRCILK